MVSKKCQIICLTSSGYFWHKTIRGFYSNIITSKLEIRKSHDLAKDSGGTASKAEKKICKSKTDCKLSIYRNLTKLLYLKWKLNEKKKKRNEENKVMTSWRTPSDTSKDEICEFAARWDPHVVHTLRARLARDEIINSLRSALHEEKRSWSALRACESNEFCDTHLLLLLLLLLLLSGEQWKLYLNTRNRTKF